MEAWNVLLEQLGHAQAENKQMKKFVKKYVPFNKRNNDYHKQNPKPNKQMQRSETDEEIVPKVNKVEVHNEPDEDEESTYMLWNLQMENETSDLHHDVECDNGAHANHTPQINVILSNTGMASEFPVQIGSFTTKCLFDSGASHSCMSYRCFKSAFPTEAPEDINGLTVQNASGKSMKPLGKYDVTITLGKKKFTHEFIICEELTSAVIIGLDFSSQFRIGADWMLEGTMYLHQGRQKLIDGKNKAETDDTASLQRKPHLVLKTNVTLPPQTMSLVPARITEPELVHPDQYLASEVDPLFEAQYPDVATIPLLHKTSDKDHQDLTVCMVNPGEWEVTIPKGKTVQQIQPLTGQVHVNWITVEQREVDSIPDTILTHKNNTTTTGIVMPGDYSPHQEYELEDAEVAPETRK